MPIYEYICENCCVKFDALRAMSEADEPIKCPHCSGERTSRQLAVFFARSSSRAIAGTSNACGSCSSSSCASCR